MLILKTSQLKLQEDGRITFQPDATNPMPGEEVARVAKGADALSPAFEATNMPAALSLADIEKWWPQYLAETVEDLVKLDQGEDISGPALEIAKKLKESLGIIPRHEIEDLIGQLDEEGRKSLRARKVKLGPILVFVYTLNKPVAVRLRALLWSLHNDSPLPAKVPADGIVSAVIAEQDINHDFFRSIGYPVYGNRAIRIDMLDRVINLIYDTADKGKFQAKHEMAEWLGCSIPDLYSVLEAMGHRKVYAPADEVKVEETQGQAPESEAPSEEPQAEKKVEEAEAPEAEKPAEAEATAAQEVKEGPETSDDKEEKTEAVDKPKEQVKPELATFALKKGKAYTQKKPATGQGAAKKYEGKDFKSGYKGQKNDKKPKHKNKKDKKQARHDGPRVYSAGPDKKDDDDDSSPFAALKKLKAGGDGS